MPSGVVRFLPSIQTPHGQVLQARISAMVSCPSGVTSPLGVPRFSSATLCPASAVAGPPGGAGWSAPRSARPTSITAVGQVGGEAR